MEEAEDSRDALQDPGDRFPAFRKLKGERHYYKVTAPDHFLEVQFVGGRKIFHEVHARAYPERLRIAEMIDGDDGRYLVITASEWEAAEQAK